ncbi:DUF6247 family protein [Streptomyces canus]|uniref:DUF6247 family protein n=1 Tax=Streptomyces canus TaxID=58343 RepID=UPI0036CDE0D4
MNKGGGPGPGTPGALTWSPARCICVVAREAVPAFEQDWANALEDARHSLAPLHDVVRTWQARLAAAPAVDAFIASG